MDTNEMLELCQGFAELASQLHSSEDKKAAAHRASELAVKYVEGCGCASITSLRGKQAHTLATSDEMAAQLDRLQLELDEGPSLDAIWLDTNYVVSDLIAEARWPRFARLAVRATSIRSALTFKLVPGESSVLTMYGERPAGFSESAIQTATMLASHTSTLMALVEAEDHSTNLETALQSSREIGIALGVLMAHRKVTHDEAFAMLRGVSQNLHRKLRDVAAEVMETGTLPELPRPLVSA